MAGGKGSLSNRQVQRVGRSRTTNPSSSSSRQSRQHTKSKRRWMYTSRSTPDATSCRWCAQQICHPHTYSVSPPHINSSASVFRVVLSNYAFHPVRIHPEHIPLAIPSFSSTICARMNNMLLQTQQKNSMSVRFAIRCCLRCLAITSTCPPAIIQKYIGK